MLLATESDDKNIIQRNKKDKKTSIFRSILGKFRL